MSNESPTPPPGSAATAERPYVVLKRGLFWRPNDRGYTYNIAEAGRYTREEAEARCHPDNEPVTMELASKYESMKTYTQAELDQHVAAATAKERQARELAEGELVEARKGWAYFAGWSASSQKYEVCHWQGRDSNVPKFDTLEAAWEEAERRSIAARVNGLMPLAPAPAGGKP
jgi:hypothetical protein